MQQHLSEELSRQDQRRVEPFLDCIAYLLAKRWIREQRQQEEEVNEALSPLEKED